MQWHINLKGYTNNINTIVTCNEIKTVIKILTKKMNAEGEEGWKCSIYFVWLCKNRTMKPVEITLRTGA
jgi:hypothetical protein